MPKTASASRSQAQQTTTLHIALVGDSLAYGAGDELRKGIGGRLAAYLEEHGVADVTTTNLGVNGARTADLAARLRRADIQAKLRDAGAIVLSIGANDLFATPVAREELLKSPFLVANQILERVAAIVGQLHEINPDATVLLLGGYNPVPWHAQSKLINQYLELWDAALANRFEEDKRVGVVKMSDIVAPTRLSRLDSFHPGGEAYQAAAERIAAILATAQRG